MPKLVGGMAGQHEHLLRKGPMSEFAKVEIVLKVALLPSSTSFPLEAVKRQLNNLLFRYSESIAGVPISFSELKFPRGKEYGRILAEHHWLHVDVTTKLLVFKPEMGMNITGQIMKVISKFSA